MSELNVQQRKFVVKAGMTVDDVKNSKEATAMQKKYASAFDTDGQKGFSQKEADLFNATTFSEKADGSVMFWTRQKDGTKKGTKFNSKDTNIQFKSEDEVKPYVKKVAVKKANKKQEQSVSFFDERWSGHQIAKITGDNAITDWLQDKDKVCTDGKDDGKIGFWEGAKSFAKGLIGGIPKAVINHPLATAATVVAGAAAVALTGGAILPVLGAVGVATGVGIVGYGGYKALTAETDGEAKQALETMGLGVTTTALSVASAEKTLEKAAEAGVKSAQVSKDASFIDKTVKMFKAIPECLTKSKEWVRLKLDLPILVESDNIATTKKYGENSYIKIPSNNQDIKEIYSADGLYKKTYKGKLVESITPDGEKTVYPIYREYDFDDNLSKLTFHNGTTIEYDRGDRYTDYICRTSIHTKDGASWLIEDGCLVRAKGDLDNAIIKCALKEKPIRFYSSSYYSPTTHRSKSLLDYLVAGVGDGDICSAAEHYSFYKTF